MTSLALHVWYFQIPSDLIFISSVCFSLVGQLGCLSLPYSFLLPEQGVKPCPQSHMLLVTERQAEWEKKGDVPCIYDAS